MKKFQILLLLVIIGVQALTASNDWGETGHRAVGEIADSHLSRKAKRAIQKLLDGESLAFVSTYADEIRSDKIIADYSAWHYVNFPFGEKYESFSKSDKGDLITAIYKCIDVLKSNTTNKEEKVFHLKLLAHFIGDLHQPLHVGIADDRGGNKVQVQWFGEGTNLHSVWDYKVIESYNMSYSELAENVNSMSKEDIIKLQQSSVIDWMYESREICEDIYVNTKSGDNLSYEYRYKYIPVMRKQIQKGGIRLAGLLNEIFG